MKLIRSNFCIAICFAFCVGVSACASSSINRDYAAYGYSSPGLNSEPELIGVYSSLDDCRDAADGWTTRQVVGNPIHAECYPVDKN